MAPVRVPTHGPPTMPGEMLLEEFLKPMGVSQTALAEAVGVSFQMINGITNGHRAISTEMALRFSRFFGNSAGFWINMQLVWDLYHAQRTMKKELAKIQPVGVV